MRLLYPRKESLLPVLCLLPALLLCWQAPAQAGESGTGERPSAPAVHEYTFGIFPYLPLVKLEGTFAPLALELSKALGRAVHYSSAATFEKFSCRLKDAEFDIAYIQPFDYVRIAAPAGYLPVAKRRTPLFALFVVKRENAFKGLHDLKGATVVFPPEESAMAYLGKAALIENGLRPERDMTVRYAKEHHSCLQQVAVGEAAACVTSEASLRAFDRALQEKLRVLEKTPDIPPVLFVVHKRVPPKDRKAIKQTLLKTTLSGVAPELRAPLAADGAKPFIAAAAADYEVVRRYAEVIAQEQ